MSYFRIISVISFLLVAVRLTAAPGNATADSLMKVLDKVISDRDRYLAEKKSELASLHAAYDSATDDYGRFQALKNLYDNYYSFNTDSAYSQSVRQKAIAEKLGDKNLLTLARMNHASILSATGMYYETVCLADSIRRDGVPDYLLPYYYHIRRTVYGRLADSATYPYGKEKYDSLTQVYRDSIMAVNPPGSLPHVITRADCMNVSGNPHEAVALMEDYMSSNDLSEHDKAICAWTLAESYLIIGEKEKRKESLIISSIADMKASVREYISLRELALLLYEEGDYDRAYKFMTIAVNDAAECNARQRIIELHKYYPTINGIYVDTVQRQKHKLSAMAVLIAVLSLFLIVLLLFTLRQMKRIAMSRREIEQTCQKLNVLTGQLRIANSELSKINREKKEISELKGVYIGLYMDECVEYIDKLDTFRKSLARLVSSGKLDNAEALVKSPAVINKELKTFYSQFDATFLSLFPTFVEEFNALLVDADDIMPKKTGSLTPELRIFALMRLGITDSDKIAKFLRYSITTIYNYRAKIRTRARGDRALLEQKVMSIGRR